MGPHANLIGGAHLQLRLTDSAPRAISLPIIAMAYFKNLMCEMLSNDATWWQKLLQGSGHGPEAEAQIFKRIARQYRNPHSGLDSLRRLHMPTHDNNVTEITSSCEACAFAP